MNLWIRGPTSSQKEEAQIKNPQKKLPVRAFNVKNFPALETARISI